MKQSGMSRRSDLVPPTRHCGIQPSSEPTEARTAASPLCVFTSRGAAGKIACTSQRCDLTPTTKYTQTSDQATFSSSSRAGTQERRRVDSRSHRLVGGRDGVSTSNTPGAQFQRTAFTPAGAIVPVQALSHFLPNAADRTLVSVSLVVECETSENQA